MLRKWVYGLAVLMMFFTACSKQKPTDTTSQVYVKYSTEEQYIVIEEVTGQWDEQTVTLMAEGFDHELLKLYLPEITHAGSIPYISEQNISFSDGLDFESTKFLDGSITITELDETSISGTFKVSLLDDVNGIEARGIEGSFKIVQQH